MPYFGNKLHYPFEMKQNIKLNFVVSEKLDNMRLDQTLSVLADQYSRTLLKRWIQAGFVKVNDSVILQPRHKMRGNQTITIDATLEAAEDAIAQPIALDVIFEDQDLIVINKPVGLVVHPGAGNKDNTLLNALLHHAPELALLPRAGIIHRLDKDTSGLLIVARNLESYKKLVSALEEREIKREYEAVVYGTMISGGTIDKPLGRHKTKRTAMAVVEENGKPAVTHYRVLHRFPEYTHIKVMLETGRTHQIRVHMAYIHHPVVGDQTYAGRLKLPKEEGDLKQFLRTFKRQALHAKYLEFTHPRSEKIVTFTASLPDDMNKLLELLRT